MATYTATLTPNISTYPVIILSRLSLTSVRALRYTFEQAFHACEVISNETGELIYSFIRSEEMYPSHISIAEAVEQITEHLDYIEGRTAEDDNGHLWDVDAYCDDDDN